MHHFCIVRRDLPLGVLAAQLIHAAGGSSPGALPESTYAIALAAKDEAELLAIERRLTDAGVSHVAVRETDAPWCGALMALGLAPAAKSKLKRHLSSLPLLKEVTLRAT